MPPYTEADLIRARRPLADAPERGEAACTLGHLETEQRETPTPERAAIISEVSAGIAAFDGVPTQTTPGSTPPAAPTAPAAPPRPTLSPVPAPVASTADGLHAGIDASRASMERTLRRQGLTPVGAVPAGASIGATSMARTLRRMGMAPRAGG